MKDKDQKIEEIEATHTPRQLWSLFWHFQVWKIIEWNLFVIIVWFLLNTWTGLYLTQIYSSLSEISDRKSRVELRNPRNMCICVIEKCDKNQTVCCSFFQEYFVFIITDKVRVKGNKWIGVSVLWTIQRKNWRIWKPHTYWVERTGEGET